jgi:hypothetical protein
MSKQNPKLEGSEIIDCIPQKGKCKNGCLDCYYNNGFYLDLETELPQLPTLEEVGDKIVRVNSGHDSNLQKDKVLISTEQYTKKFYNTSIPNFNFPSPVIYTINGRLDDVEFENNFNSTIYTCFDYDYLHNLMAIRFRVNTWNTDLLKKICDWCKEFFMYYDIPILLTFMRYTKEETILESERKYYTYRKSILNSYYCINEEGWNKVIDEMKDYNIKVCGKTYGNSYCKNCGNCVEFYNNKMKEDLYV